MATLEEYKKKLLEKKQKQSKNEWLRLPSKAKEKVKIKVVPYNDSGGLLFPYSIHWISLKESEDVIRRYRVPCTGSKCPICKVLNEYRKQYPPTKEGFNQYVRKVGRMLSKDMLVYNVLDLSDMKVKLLEIGSSFGEWLVQQVYEVGLDLTSWESPYYILLWRERDKGKFEKATVPSEPLSEEFIEKAKKEVVNLDVYFKNYPKPEDLQKQKELAEKLSLYLFNTNILTESKENDITVLREEEDDEEDIPLDLGEQVEMKEQTTQTELNIPEQYKECFGKEFLKKDECITCPVSADCMEA